MAQQILDKYGRPLTYLRLSVTDRCNLRCSYCMPHEKMEFVPRKDLLSYEEMLRLVNILVGAGLKKVRITGGEPFVRKDLIHFLSKLADIENISLHITTNGILINKYLSELKALGIKGINLSLDTLDEANFRKITRRDSFHETMEAVNNILKSDIPLKINTVVMKGVNDHELIDLATLAKENKLEVRFIEEMPFDGESLVKDYLNYKSIYYILSEYLPLTRDFSPATSENFCIDGWKGKIGIIPAFTRTFCGTCDRIRINATGKLKTCLYGGDALDLRELLRSGCADETIFSALSNAYQNRPKDGFEAEKENKFIHQSMATIGG